MGALGEPPRSDEVPDVGEVRVLRAPQRCRAVRHLAPVQVPHPRPRRRALSGGRARPRHPRLSAWARPVHPLVRRSRLRRRGRRHPPSGHRRVPADDRRAEPGLVRGSPWPPRRAHRRGVRRVGGPGGPGALLARHPRSAGTGHRNARLLRRRERDAGRGAGDGVADRLHRRSRLRALDPGRRRPHGLGCGLAEEPWARGHPGRPDGPLHGPDRSRIAAARCRFPLQPLRLDGRRPLDPDRARLRLDVPRHRHVGSGLPGSRRDPPGARRADLALEARWPGGRLARLRPDPRRRRAHPAQGSHADRGGVLRLRRRSPPGRLRDEPDVLADAPTAHRPGTGAPRPNGAGSRVKLELPVNHRYEYVDAYVAKLPLFDPSRRTA